MLSLFCCIFSLDAYRVILIFYADVHGFVTLGVTHIALCVGQKWEHLQLQSPVSIGHGYTRSTSLLYGKTKIYIPVRSQKRQQVRVTQSPSHPLPMCASAFFADLLVPWKCIKKRRNHASKAKKSMEENIHGGWCKSIKT